MHDRANRKLPLSINETNLSFDSLNDINIGCIPWYQLIIFILYIIFALKNGVWTWCNMCAFNCLIWNYQ